MQLKKDDYLCSTSDMGEGVLPRYREPQLLYEGTVPCQWARLWLYSMACHGMGDSLT